MSDDHKPDGLDEELRDASPRRQPSEAQTAGATAYGVEFGAAGPAEAEGLDPFYFLRVLHKWRWPAITVFLLAVAVATVYAYTTIPIYEARARLLIETERLNIVRIEDIVELNRSLDAQVAVLQSRWIAKKTMESLRQPTIEPRQPSSAATTERRGLPSVVRALRSQAVAWASRLLGWSPEPTKPIAGPVETNAESGRIDAFLAGLTVSTTTKGVIDVKYRSPDPTLAATIANGLARQYIDQNLETHFAAIEEVTEWLAARLAEQRRKVDASEQALQRFREANHMVVVTGAEDPTVAKLNELSTAITRAKTARFEKEALFNKAQALRSDPVALARLPQMLSDSIVQQLWLEVEKLQRERAEMSEKLQDRHPDMIKIGAAIQAAQSKLQSEFDRVVESTREDAATARATEANLSDAFEAQKREALAKDQKGVELGILQREAQSNQQIYDMLMQRARETSIAKEIRPAQARILDPADVPAAPVSPDTRQNVLLGSLAGLALGIALAFGLEQIDNRIKTPDEIKSRLGLPLLGFVPEVYPRNGSDGPPSLTNGVPSAFVEAVRSIRTNVLYSVADESLKAIVITSASLSEGKTVVAGNLAIAIAQAGQRVLLIDADMRRPTLHELFKLKRDPGLSNLLVGSSKASEVVQSSGTPNLWVMPSGHRPPNPPELLASRRFKNMMTALAEHFDWVLLDAPPIVPVTDACVIADNTVGVVFVVGAERVSRHVVRRALEQLGNVKAHVIGGILTRMEIERHRYYYSKYYQPKYGEYASLGSQNS